MNGGQRKYVSFLCFCRFYEVNVEGILIDHTESRARARVFQVDRGLVHLFVNLLHLPYFIS